MIVGRIIIIEVAEVDVIIGIDVVVVVAEEAERLIRTISRTIPLVLLE